jgi:hypothetical protein
VVLSAARDELPRSAVEGERQSLLDSSSAAAALSPLAVPRSPVVSTTPTSEAAPTEATPSPSSAARTTTVVKKKRVVKRTSKSPAPASSDATGDGAGTGAVVSNPAHKASVDASLVQFARVPRAVVARKTTSATGTVKKRRNPAEAASPTPSGDTDTTTI